MRCSNSGSRGRGSWFDSTSNDQDRLIYEHCGHTRHTKENFWDLHGHPPQKQAHSFPRGGFRGGKGRGCFESRPSAYTIASKSSDIMPIVSFGSSDSGGLP